MAQAERIARTAQADFSVDRESELPLGVQLVWRIRGMVALEILRPGDRLPSVRELAAFSGANVNTARSAYAALEGEGLLESQHGRGTFVVDGAAAPGGLREAAERAVSAAAEAGATPQELIAAIYAASPASPVAGREDEATLRRALRAQIAHLERELAGYAWEDTRDPAPTGPETARPAGSVSDSAALERTRDALLTRLARLRDGSERRGEAEQAARMRRAELAADPAAHPWEVVSDEEAGEAGGGEWQVVPRFGPVGAIMGWWRVRVAPSPGAGEAPSGSRRR